MNAALDTKFARIRAALSLKGFALVRGEDDAGRPLFIVSRWSMTRQLRGLPELEAFAAQIAPKVKATWTT